MMAISRSTIVSQLLPLSIVSEFDEEWFDPAIFVEEETPEEFHSYIELNKKFFEGDEERIVATGKED